MRPTIVCALLMAALIGLGAGCGGAGEGGKDRPDGGQVDGGDGREDTGDQDREEVALGAFGYEGGFALLPATGGTMEVISGFQGGVHVEPGLLFDPAVFTDAQLSGSVTFRVRRLSDDEVISEASIYPFEPYSFRNLDSGYRYHSPPVIFALVSSGDEVADQMVRLEVDLELANESEARELRVEVELVDEIDELGGGR